MKLFIGFLVILFSALTFGAANTTGINVFSYSTTNVTTSAYVVLAASTPSPVSNILVCDTSGQLLKIAKGATGSEIDLFTTTVSGCVQIKLVPALPIGTKLSIKAISASATTGFNTVSFLL